MTKDYSQMSEAELVELQRKIERELAERKQASKPKKLLAKKPRVEKSKLKAPPLEQMAAQFCRKCGEPIWEYITKPSNFLRNDSTSLFYVEGQGNKPRQVTHCPKCKRKLSPGRLRYREEIEEAFREGRRRSESPPKVDGMMAYKYCVECGYKIGLLENSDPPQFFDEADRQKPISTCPSCNTPLKEADDVDYNDEQRSTLGSVYQFIHQRAAEIRVSQRELAELLEKIRVKKPESLQGIKAIIGVHAAWDCKDKTSLKEQLARCRDYSKTNGLEVIEELSYSYQNSHKKLQLENLLKREVGAIVASMNWLTGYSQIDAAKFVYELERAGIHLEIIAGEDGNPD